MKGSAHIAVIGGGPVGVEIAAELKTDYPDKSVTLIHPNNDLLRPGLSDKFHRKLRQILEDRMKVELKLGTSRRFYCPIIVQYFMLIVRDIKY